MNFWMFKMTWIFVVFFLWFATFTPSERVALESAFLVLIGVIGEYVAEVDAVEQRKRLKTGIKRFSMAILVLGLSGDVLGIVMGQAEMEALTKEAGDAVTSAHNAATDAGKAQTLAQGASNAAGEAQNKSETANLAAGDAQKKAEALGKEADILEYVLSARRVQDEVGLENDLRKDFKGRHIAFRSYVGDEEAFWLCSQLTDIANKAGVGLGPQFECGSEPLSYAPIADFLIKGSREEAMLLSQILTGPGRVPGGIISLSEAPEITVLVGVKRSFLLWPKKEKAPTKQAKSKTSAKR